MLNIASIYHFTLMQRLSPKYKQSLSKSIENVIKYIQEEGIEVLERDTSIGEYKLKEIYMKGVGLIQFFHRYKRQRELYFYPSFFADIYIEKQHIKNTESIKRSIFLLSNIFECFDHFEEKNTMIEFHKAIYETVNKDKQYSLRHDFIDINSLSKFYNEENISDGLKSFIRQNHKIINMSDIKNKFPKIYRILLYFLYNIFALEKSLKSTNKKLQELHSFQEKSGENMHVELSQKRLELNQASLSKTLSLYRTNFENFMNVIMQK